MSDRNELQEQIDALDMALEQIAEAAEVVENIARETDDEYLRRTAVAELQGQNGGWMGVQAVDMIIRKRDELQDALYDGVRDLPNPGDLVPGGYSKEL